MLILETKLKNGKEETVFVNTTTLDNSSVVPHKDPNLMRDQLIRQMMKTELEDIIASCKEIGSTDGKGDAQRDTDSSSSDDLTSAVVNAKKGADEAQLQAQQASLQDDRLQKVQVSEPKETVKTEAEQKAEQQAEERAKQEQAAKVHDLIWNHNVFWALLNVAMLGNSSIFNILSQALGQNADLLEGNQYATSIITKLNNDLQSLVAGNLSPSQIRDLLNDIKNELNTLSHIVDPNAPGINPDPEKTKEANKSLGPDILKQLKDLVGQYTTEIEKTAGCSLESLLEALDSKNPSDVKDAMDRFNKFRNDMINQSGTKSPSSGPTGIYSKTSSMLTTLNTAGSQFMAQQNLDTKQLDQIEKLWTSGYTTEKGINQSVIGNIAN